MHAFVPPAETTGHKPSAALVAAALGDGGEAALRAALTSASREVIERIVWEVVPQLAETIIRENLDRLVKQRPQ
jgi:methylmalonyl-CoA mutase cobalamin-binding subunit